MLVVVAVGDGDAARAEAELRAHDAATVVRSDVTPGRALLYATLRPGRSADGVVADLRASGWAATTRPVSGGHLTAWIANNGPTVISERLCVCFPWSEFDRAGAPGAVEIDPGRAFGTGAHPSTRLLLRELADRLHPSDTVLDVGCGSGVLAVAAARLGACVVAVDLAPEALSATRANARHNGVDGRVEVRPGGVEAVTEQFAAVVANIGAGELVRLAPALGARVAAGGWLGLSGLSPAQLSVVTAAFRGLDVISSGRDDDWAAVVLAHPPDVTHPPVVTAPGSAPPRGDA